jgi:mono/diheme cytochrome c family protein
MGARIKAGILLVGLAAAAHAPRLAAQPSGGADARAAAFAQSGCGVCHGADGAGTTAGPRLATGALALPEFTAAVRRGQRTMPAYGAQALSDERLAEIFAYLQSQRAADVATGRAETGARLFAAYGCYSCHGNEAQGGAAGPRLGPGPISFARFEWYVRHPSLQMPPYSAVIVSDQDVADIYAFVESRPRPAPLDSISVLAP